MFAATSLVRTEAITLHSLYSAPMTSELVPQHSLVSLHLCGACVRITYSKYVVR
jgi:hypothetical protein